MTFLEPYCNRDDLTGYDGRFGKSEDASECGEKHSVCGQTASDACQGPHDYSDRNHRLGTEFIHEDSRDRIHYCVADQEHVHYPCVLNISDAEIFQNFRFQY